MIEPYYETDLGKLYHGDCHKIIPQLNLDMNATAILTDPLYGDNVPLQRAKENLRDKPRILKGLHIKRKDWPEMPGNSEPLDPVFFLDFKQIILWGGNYIADKLPPSRKWIVWDKLIIPPSNHHDLEMAWTNLPGVSRIHRQLWRGICREGEENITNGPKLHPFQKPIQLMIFCLEQFGLSSVSVVLDPFAGSGTTLVACERMNIPYIGIDIENWCCEIAAKRIENERKQLKLFT